MQLLKFVNRKITSKSAQSQVDTVFLDLSKAFDSVVHSKLLYKMHHLGISEDAISWTKSFLSKSKIYLYILIRMYK